MELNPGSTYHKLLVHRCAAYYKLTPETEAGSKSIAIMVASESRMYVVTVSFNSGNLRILFRTDQHDGWRTSFHSMMHRCRHSKLCVAHSSTARDLRHPLKLVLVTTIAPSGLVTYPTGTRPRPVHLAARGRNLSPCLSVRRSMKRHVQGYSRISRGQRKT